MTTTERPGTTTLRFADGRTTTASFRSRRPSGLKIHHLWGPLEGRRPVKKAAAALRWLHADDEATAQALARSAARSDDMREWRLRLRLEACDAAVAIMRSAAARQAAFAIPSFETRCTLDTRHGEAATLDFEGGEAVRLEADARHPWAEAGRFPGRRRISIDLEEFALALPGLGIDGGAIGILRAAGRLSQAPADLSGNLRLAAADLVCRREGLPAGFPLPAGPWNDGP